MRIYPLLLLELIILLLVSYLLAVLTFDYGDEARDAPIFYSYNYKGFRSIFISLLFLHTINNFPDMIIDRNVRHSHGLVAVPLSFNPIR